MPQLTLDSAILEMLLNRAASAARHIGYLDDVADSAISTGPLANDIDTIVHTLSELLGNPHLVTPVSSARSSFAPDDVARQDVVTQAEVPELASGCGASRASRTHTLAMTANGDFRSDSAPVPDLAELVIAFIGDESTQPRVRRFRPMHGCQRQRVQKAPATIGTKAMPINNWQARAQRTVMSEDARSATRWVRGATVTALIALVGLGLWVLGFGGGDR
jgi:hypothetical protein